MKKDIKFRSNCQISCALDVIGDKWSILIIRDILIFGKKTFKDFVNSNEKIATNILSLRLKKLEHLDIISKNNHPTNKKVFNYKLTKSGEALLPILKELAFWSNEHIIETNKRQSNEEIELFLKGNIDFE